MVTRRDFLENIGVKHTDGALHQRVDYVALSDTVGLDAFGRTRVSQPQTLFDSKQIVDAQALFWDDAEISGGGTSSTYQTNQASVALAVSADTAGVRARQTFMRFNYQPGKSQLAVMTGTLGAGAAGITRRLGAFDAQNGLFFQLSGSVLSVVVRTFTGGSAHDTVVAQSAWNADKLDGSGASGQTIDPSKAQIFFIDFEWLGVGRVRFGVFIHGQPVVVHAVNHFNQITLPYMSTPNLPLRYEISNDGSGGAASLLHICSTVISEGGQEATGLIRSTSRGASSITTPDSTALVPLISLRLKSTHLGITINVLRFAVICTSTADFEAILLLNPTVAGVDAASWTALANSAIEYDISRDNTNLLTGGVALQGGLVAQTNQNPVSLVPDLQNALRLGAKIDGTRDQLVLAARRLTGTTESFFARIEWRELQ